MLYFIAIPFSSIFGVFIVEYAVGIHKVCFFKVIFQFIVYFYIENTCVNDTIQICRNAYLKAVTKAEIVYQHFDYTEKEKK